MTIPAQFRDGPLAGTVLDVDLEKHDHTDRRTGAYYVRMTEWNPIQRELVSYFVLRHYLVPRQEGRITAKTL